jgi:hypothetical protein
MVEEAACLHWDVGQRLKFNQGKLSEHQMGKPMELFVHQPQSWRLQISKLVYEKPQNFSLR